MISLRKPRAKTECVYVYCFEKMSNRQRGNLDNTKYDSKS